MGFKDFATNTILRMDLLSSSPTFRTRKQPCYETMVGGVFSFLLMGLFSYFLYLQLSSMFQKLTITYSSGLSDDIESTDAITQFPFAISIDGVDLSVTPKKFIIELTQTQILKNVGGPPTVTTTNIPLTPCASSDWSKYGTSFTSQFSAFGFGEMLCINNAQAISLSGYAGSDTYQYLSLNIIQCNQTNDASCDSTVNINTYMNNYISTNDYFKVRFFVVDTIITPTNDEAIEYALEKNIFMAFSDTIGTVGYVYMAEYALTTDTSILPLNTYETDSGTYIQKFVSNSVSLSTTKYVNFNIYRSTKSLAISRTIGKLDTILSYVGGLFGLLFTGVAFFLGSYSQYKYQLYVAESMLTDDSGDRVKADDLNFITYFFYCCYDWMDTFGIAPSCFKTLKRIHEIRQESCEQLDPALILKRIKYLQSVSRVLINEHRQMCLYLSEPLTLQQAKRMRASLLYYDQIVNELEQKGDSKEQSFKVNQNQKMFAFKRNAIQNSSELQSAKPLEHEPPAELSQEEEKKILDNLIYEAIVRLEQDNSEIGKQIRARVGEKKRQWIRQNKRGSTANLTLKMVSPTDSIKQQQSFQRMLKEDKGKILVKKVKR